MNPLDLFRTERQKQLAAQESRRSWSARAVHRHLNDNALERPRARWAQRAPDKPLLAVLNIPGWPQPGNGDASVRFLDLVRLARGDAQWLRRTGNLNCPLTMARPEQACLFAIPEEPHLKILCLTPAGWASPFRRLALLQAGGGALPALDTIKRVLAAHQVPFQGLILTSPENLQLQPGH